MENQREKERLRALFSLYGLGEVHRAEPVRPGTVARVWHVSAEAGDFLVRTLPGEAAGEREWSIFRHLTERGFTAMPAIRLAENGAPMARIGETWYQVQNFCPGVRPAPAQPGVCRAAAELSLELTAALKGGADLPGAEDRFDLAAAWQEGRDRWESLNTGKPLAWADRQVEALCAREEGEVQLIHGDLGPWNLLWDAPRLRVVDFGEARMGAAYFDLASMLAGCINHAPAQERSRVLSEFLDVWKDVDLPRLREQLAMWTWRGCAQWLTRGEPALREKMVGKFLSALVWTEENLPGA